MGAFVGLAGKALKAVLKIALFCGLAWFLIPFGVWLATELITGKYLEQVPVMNTVCNILWCSKLVGTYDKKKVSSNYNADIMGVGKGQGTSSSTEEKRIIKPEEFAYLQDVVCVFPNGYKRLQKANYYEDSTFTSKM